MRRRSDMARVLLSALAVAPACGPDADDTGPHCIAASAAPTELIPWVRIRASGTRPAEGHDWARETEAGPATVRDDDPDNGWQPPDGEGAVLELDLQPWLGRRVSLRTLEASWSGQLPEVSVALLPGCGLEPYSELSWDDPSQPLDLEGRCAGCVELRVLGGEDTVLHSLSLTSGDGYIDVPLLDGVTELFEPGSHPGSGLIEGFYGQPWSWRERKAALVTLWRTGQGLYLYAPKDDPYHRDQWREPYPSDQQDAFAELAAVAQVLDVKFVVGISPFIDLDPEDEGDWEILRDKLLGFAEMGVGGVALLADDIEFEVDVTVDAELGATHASFANRLLAELQAEHPDMGLWFVPTVYSDERMERWEGAPAYLEALQALDPSIPVMWTGSGTFAQTIEAADMDTVRGLIGRDPLIWDNYWANDAWDWASGRVHLSAYQGRAADLADAVDGIGANPMTQGALSRLNAGALAAWLEEPGEDTELLGWATAASVEALLGYGHQESTAKDATLLLRLMEAFEGSGLDMPAHAELESWVEAFAEDPETAARRLLPILAGLAVAESELHHSGLDSELVDELYFPGLKLHHEGMAGLWALRALAERCAGRDGDEAMELAREQLELSGESRFVFSIGSLEDLVEAVPEVPVRDGRLDPPVVVPSTIPGCVAGERWTWRPFPNVEQVDVHGLPGADVEGDTVRWTPPHPGSFTAVFTSTSAMGGWGWRAVELRCAPG